MKIYKTIEKILKGIDKTESESKDGWWETSTGALFGKRKLEELKAELKEDCELLDKFVNLTNDDNRLRESIHEAINQFKEEHKKDVINAWQDGFIECSNTELENQDDDFTEEQTNNYYKQKFES